MARYTWRPLRTADGSWTLVHDGLGQACHSTDGAWFQARERYARPTRLAERARERAFPQPARCRLLDVGTGLGLNLAAALEALDGTGVALDATTLERDPEVIRAGLECLRAATDLPPGLARHHAPVAAALERALEVPDAARAGVPLRLGSPGDRDAPRADAGTLRLLLGDARETLPRLAAGTLPEHEHGEAFDAVFLDPFSPAVDAALWEADFLAALARRMAPGSLLSTYSASLEVRARLVAAGLAVGRGPRVGRKAEGTLAARGATLPLLAPRTARRLQKRVARLAPGPRR